MKNTAIKTSMVELTICFGFLLNHLNVHMLIMAVSTLFLTIFFMLGWSFYCNRQIRNSLAFIHNYSLPEKAIIKFKNEYPHLDQKQIKNVISGLKQFFMIYAVATHRKNKNSILMPSKVADELWHQFMLFSRDYQDFCQKAFGKFLHHSPGEENNKNANLAHARFPKDLLATYQGAKDLKDYDYQNLLNFTPILFALDKSLNVQEGYYYDESAVANLEKQVVEQPQTTASSSNLKSSSGSDCGTSCSATSSCSSGGGCGD